MGILTQFTSPQDVRWQGGRRTHHLIFLVKSIFLIPLTILVIVEQTSLRKWYAASRNSFDDWWTSSGDFWFRVGIALIPDVLLAIISLVLILNPLHRATYSFHPVFALVSSFIVWGLYISVCCINPLVGYANEISFYNNDVWLKLVYAETAFQVLMCILYFTMFVYSCIAVDRWRMAQKMSKMHGEINMARLGGDGAGENPA